MTRAYPRPRRRRLCARCGADASGADAEHARLDVRLHHGREGSCSLLALPLCPSCAADAAAHIAEWMEDPTWTTEDAARAAR